MFIHCLYGFSTLQYDLISYFVNIDKPVNFDMAQTLLAFYKKSGSIWNCINGLMLLNSLSWRNIIPFPFSSVTQ